MGSAAYGLAHALQTCTAALRKGIGSNIPALGKHHQTTMIVACQHMLVLMKQPERSLGAAIRRNIFATSSLWGLRLLATCCACHLLPDADLYSADVSGATGQNGHMPPGSQAALSCSSRCL